MQFFRHFPTVPYQFNTGTANLTMRVVNTTATIRITESLKEHLSILHTYEIQDGERPDSVSHRLYGSVDYTWVILILNQIMSPYDWPLTYDEFNRYIEEQYGSISTAQATNLYETIEGYRVDATTWAAMPVDERGSIISVYDDELRTNEQKRRIKIVPPAMVASLAAELTRVAS